jgi:hypothetical protein
MLFRVASSLLFPDQTCSGSRRPPMFAGYALAAPLEGQFEATVLLGSIGWVALASLTVGLVAIVVLVARTHLEQRRDRLTPAALRRPHLPKRHGEGASLSLQGGRESGRRSGTETAALAGGGRR